MRVLFTVFPASAHLYPVVPLAWALQAAGHEVVVAAHEGVVDPDVINNITKAGLTALRLGRKEELPDALGRHTGEIKPDRPTLAFDPKDDDPDTWRLARFFVAGMLNLHYPTKLTEDGRRPIVDNLVQFAKDWRPDLILWDPLVLPAPIAAKACGAAHARLLWGTDNIGVIHERTKAELANPIPPKPDEDPRLTLTEDPLEAWMRPLLDAHGLEFSDEMLLGQFSLDLTQSRMRQPLDLTYVPVRRVPYTGAGEFPSWLHKRPERPRAVLTLGMSRRNIYGKYSGFPMRELFDSVADLDLELIATLNSDQLATVGAVPDNVRTVEYIPLNQVMPTSSAVIHHGGGGTFASAVAFQVPQLVVPLPMWDEMVTARYVVDRGAGLVVDPEGLDVADMAKQLVRLIEEPSFQDGARGLYEDMLSAPAPKDIVPVLERLTEQHRG
ncbi:nucleotide disphospho-sugar-binding domain-containing protein [Kitasatospora sp. NPDC058162]|uniref:nucleotide disphospho-sugar-binding domain-containing protein n=1 Tax=Kitasatospora sp. NPDC058162 TaxID=3346362 RepID=UPI0036DE67B9